MRNKFLLFKPLSLWYSLQPPEQTKTRCQTQEVTIVLSEADSTPSIQKDLEPCSVRAGRCIKIIQSRIANLQMKKLRSNQCLINFSSTNITECSFANNNGSNKDKYDTELALQELQLVDELILQSTSPVSKVIFATTHQGNSSQVQYTEYSPESC